MGECELTHLVREPIDVERARVQHRGYERCLAELGVTVISLSEDPSLPDAVFVEDAAIVLDEVAVICPMGAASRRPEAETVAAALRPFRPIEVLHTSAALDGGDVMRVGRTLFVGQSGRTNAEGLEGLRRLLTRYGYRVRGVAVKGCLHLKSGYTYLGRDTVLVNPLWVEISTFREFAVLEVDEGEPGAANALAVGKVVLLPEAFPRPRRLLEERGFAVRTLDVSELQKAEAGLTCMCIFFEPRRRI